MSNVSGAKKTGRPKTDTEAVNVRMSREMLDALDALIMRSDDPKPSRPEAVRRVLATAFNIVARDED